MQRTVDPGAASLQTCSAPANVAPEVIPTKIPSFCASCLLQCMASAFAIVSTRSIRPELTASSVSLGMKSGLQPCSGCGFHAGLLVVAEPSGLLSCLAPEVSIGA